MFVSLRFALLTLFVTNLPQPTMAQRHQDIKSYGNNAMGLAVVLSRKNGIIELTINRQVDYSTPYNGRPSSTTTFIDCTNYLKKDMRWDKSFVPIGRQSPSVGYARDFC